MAALETNTGGGLPLAPQFFPFATASVEFSTAAET